jgi:hypothetical protein
MGGDWIARALTDGDVLQMPEIGIELSLSEIYADVNFAVPEDPGAASPPV